MTRPCQIPGLWCAICGASDATVTTKHFKATLNQRQQEIIDAFKAEGATVVDLSMLGHGVPDLLVGFMGVTELVEVKGGKGKLSARQHAFRNMWEGRRVKVVMDARGAQILIGHMGGRLFHEARQKEQP